MQVWLTRKLQLRPGESLTTALMFLYILGVLNFYYILKPIRYGLFLKNFDSSRLPYAYFLTAFLTGSLAALIFKLSRRVSAITFLTATNLGIIATLFYFRWAIGREISYLPYVYFVYVQVISVLSTAQFWLLAGYIFDSRQSKRIFPLLGVGAIAGAMLGSAVSGFFQYHLSVQAMILMCIGTCTLLIVLSQLVWRRRRSEAETRISRTDESGERMGDLFRSVFGSRHVYLIVVLVFLTMIASQITDWQVSAAADAAYADLSGAAKEAAINQVYGRFYFVANIIGIILQFTLTAFVIRRAGIATAILFLPTGLFLSSIGVAVLPGLWTSLICRGSNSVFRYSINGAGLELLYMPLAPEMRKRIKVFIDVFIDRFGRAGAAVIILAMTSPYLNLGLRGTSLAIMVMSAVCIAVGLMIRKSYVESFRQKLVRSEVDLTEVSRYITDPATLRLLVSLLESSQERRMLYALRLLQSVRGYDFSGHLLPLLSHGSALVREEAVHTLAALPESHEAEVEPLLDDSAPGVRAAAVEYLCAQGKNPDLRIRNLLADEHSDVRLAAARLSAQEPFKRLQFSIDFIRSLVQAGEEGAGQNRAAAAWLAARLPAEESVPLLRYLLCDPVPEVVAAAAQAAGTCGRIELLFDILRMLVRRDERVAAREALLLFGPRIIGTLGDLLADNQADPALRREIPWVLSQFSTKRAADALLENLGAEDNLLRYQVLKALNRVHDHNPALPGPRPVIAERIYAETRRYYESLALLGSLESDGNKKSLLVKALRERLDQNLEIIFRLLGLQYSQRDIYFAYTALQGSRRERRASAIEFLDNLLQKDLKSIIIPLLEETSTERLVDQAGRLFGFAVKRPDEALLTILQQSDNWLKACALHEVGAGRITRLTDLCRAMADDRDPLVRETAVWSLQRCA